MINDDDPCCDGGGQAPSPRVTGGGTTVMVGDPSSDKSSRPSTNHNVEVLGEVSPRRSTMWRNYETAEDAGGSGGKSFRSSIATRVSAVRDLAKELALSSVTQPTLLGPIQCTAIVVNYISSGNVLLPHAFYTSGVVYSVIIFGIVSLQSYITTIFILETYARAESLNWLSTGGKLPHRYSMAIRESQYELSGLEYIFLGPRWTQFFTATVAFELYTDTWITVAIFGQALTAQIPIDFADDNGYKIWVGVFMLITIPLSCTKILDQALIQFIFLAGRIFMVILMVVTLVAAFASGGEHFSAQNGPTTDHVPLFDAKNTMAIVQTAFFSTAFQFSVPSMAGISDNKKDNMTGVFRHAVIFSYASNCLLAVLMAMYFGSATDPSSNLNWSHYHAGGTSWSKFASGYVVMFAAIDGLAVFPLMCSTLGAILLQAVFGDKASLLEDDWKLQTLFRLLAAIPQSIGSLYVQDLGVLAKYGCIFTLLSYSAAPSLLYAASGRQMTAKNLPQKTFYASRYFSHNGLAYAILIMSLLAILGVILDAAL